MALDLQIFTLRDKICAWEIYDPQKKAFYSGGARPFKSPASLEKIADSEYFDVPYTKKQLKSFDYIRSYADFFEEHFQETDAILPYGKYAGYMKNTFGEKSKVYRLFLEKAQAPKKPQFEPSLYIDFEAMNMRVCGWYGELVTEKGTQIFEGIAKPFSDARYITRLWKNTYSEMLPYTLEEILKAKHICSYKDYFLSMFRQARKIYTYGDTDSLFIKNTFGVDVYNFFRVKNLDISLRIGHRTLSLDKTCKLFGLEFTGASHNPKVDVQKMRGYIDASNRL